jgi:hypothetical protein
MVLKVRETLVNQRTQLVNALRDHAAEFGIIAAKGIGQINLYLKQSRPRQPSCPRPGKCRRCWVRKSNTSTQTRRLR